MSDAASKGIAWQNDIDIDYASIQFNPVKGASCSGYDQSSCYTASVVWTSNGTAGTNSRACGSKQTAVDDSTAPTSATLPRSIFGQGSIIAIDVAFKFVPTFGAKFLPAIRIAKSVFLQPRYASLINYDTSNDDGIATSCSS